MTELMTDLVKSSKLAFSGGMTKHLQEDIQHSLQMRLFKKARTAWDPTVQDALKALGNGARELATFKWAAGRVDEIYFTIMRKEPLSRRGVARLEAAMERYKDARTELLKVKNDDLKTLVTWNDRDFAERMRCIDVRMRKTPPKKVPAQQTAPAPTSIAPTKAATKLAQKQKEAAAALRSHRAALLYEGYVDSLSVVSKAQRNSMWRFNDYLPHDDPVWERLVDLMNESAHLPVARNPAGTSLADLVQGVVGEALALRHRAVTEIMHAQFKRAQRLAQRLGPTWEVKVADSAVWAGSLKSTSPVQLYDGAVMVVNVKQELAAPVFVLSVKSGKSTKAAIQNTGETLREFGQPMTFGAPGAEQGPTFALTNLQDLLAARGVKKAAGDAEGLSTYRLLVAPLPPSKTRTTEDLGAHVGVWFMPSILSKREMNDGAMGLTQGLKRAMSTAKKASKKSGLNWDVVP